MSDEVADVLAGAREYGEKNGWWRGSLRGPNGKQACALGWVLHSQGMVNDNELHMASEKVCKAINRLALAIDDDLAITADERYAIGAPLLVVWNDHDAENKQQVLDLFAKAEKIERAGYDPDL